MSFYGRRPSVLEVMVMVVHATVWLTPLHTSNSDRLYAMYVLTQTDSFKDNISNKTMAENWLTTQGISKST